MEYNVSFVVKDVTYKDLGRGRALTKFVTSNASYLEEFHKIENGRYRELSRSTDTDDIMEYFKAMREFATANGVTIVDECPMLTEGKRKYEVNVMYKIRAELPYVSTKEEEP